MTDTKEILSPDALSKYHGAASVTNETLKIIAEKCVDGQSISELCILGDTTMTEKLSVLFTSKKNGGVKKGVAFPTCISVNEICGHYAPLPADDRKLATGDVVKIDMGSHVDHYIAVAAHTVVVGATAAEPVEGPRAEAVLAAHYAAEVAVKMMQPGKSNNEITAMMKRVCDSFDCQMVSGVLSHQLLQNVIDGNKVILGRETNDEKVESTEFKPNEVYGLDIVVSTGEGKPRESDLKTTVFKRDVVQNYKLRTPLARSFFHEVNTNYPSLPFHLGYFEEKMHLVGISECLRHSLLHSFPVVSEKPGQFVTQFKFTIFVGQNGAKKMTPGLPVDLACLKTEKKIEDAEILAILAAEGISKKKTKSAEE